MKIFHFIYDSIGNPWLRGGGAERTQEIYKRLVNRHDVTIITGNFPGAKNNIDGVRYLRLGLTWNYPVSRLSYLLLAIIRIFISDPDLIIEDIGFPSPMIVTAFRKNTIGQIQFIPNESYSEKRGAIGKMVALLFKFGIKKYRRFITVSNYAKSYILKINGSAKVEIIPNGISLPKNNTPDSTNTTGYLLYLGRIDIKGKGLDTLIISFKSLKVNRTCLKLKIAGSGEMSEIKLLQKMITANDLDDTVELVGYKYGEEKYKLLNNCLALVLPSRNETFGIVALEAFVFGKPVIGAKIGGLEELIKDSEAGLLFNINDSITLARHIKTLANSPELIKKLGNNGLEFSKKYSWDIIAKKFEDTINIGSCNLF